MISSQPCRTAASTATLTLALPTICSRSAAGRSCRSSKQGTDTTPAATPRSRSNCPLGAGGKQVLLGLRLLRHDLIGAGGATVGLLKAKAQLRHVLARERKNTRGTRSFERELPAFRGFDRVTRAEHMEVGD